MSNLSEMQLRKCCGPEQDDTHYIMLFGPHLWTALTHSHALTSDLMCIKLHSLKDIWATFAHFSLFSPAATLSASGRSLQSCIISRNWPYPQTVGKRNLGGKFGGTFSVFHRRLVPLVLSLCHLKPLLIHVKTLIFSQVLHPAHTTVCCQVITRFSEFEFRMGYIM